MDIYNLCSHTLTFIKDGKVTVIAPEEDFQIINYLKKEEIKTYSNPPVRLFTRPKAEYLRELPEPKEDTIYIVSKATSELFPHRKDVFYPGSTKGEGALFDKKSNKLLGITRLFQAYREGIKPALPKLEQEVILKKEKEENPFDLYVKGNIKPLNK